MAETINFELVSPERLLVAKPVEMVVIPGTEGDFGVLPQHAPLIATVRPGVIQIYEGGRVVESIFIAGGFAEVAGDRCTVLAEHALPVGDLDRAEIERTLRDERENGNESEVLIAEAKLAALDQQQTRH